MLDLESIQIVVLVQPNERSILGRRIVFSEHLDTFDWNVFLAWFPSGATAARAA